MGNTAYVGNTTSPENTISLYLGGKFRSKIQLKNLGKTEDQINPPNNDGGNQQVYLPYEQVLPEEDYEREQKEFNFSKELECIRVNNLRIL